MYLFMNFDIPYGVSNEHNKKIHQVLGYGDSDLLLFQITRVVRRKGIETAIDLIHQLEDERIKLVITGNYADDEGSKYYNELVNQIHDLKLGDRVRFAYHCFHNKGITAADGECGYSLSDAYARARACTYFSIYEGFGNAFLETVYYYKPIIVNRYPVYITDIEPKNFDVIAMDGVVTAKEIEKIKNVLNNKENLENMVKRNYEIAKKYFSFEVLEKKLLHIISTFD